MTEIGSIRNQPCDTLGQFSRRDPAVQHRHLVPGFDELIDQMLADKDGTTRHQNVPKVDHT